MALDHLRLGQLDKVADCIAARFLALHQAHLDGHWDAARNLEIYCPEVLSAAGAEVTLRARKHSRMLDKVTGKGTSSQREDGAPVLGARAEEPLGTKQEAGTPRTGQRRARPKREKEEESTTLGERTRAKEHRAR